MAQVSASSSRAVRRNTRVVAHPQVSGELPAVKEMPKIADKVLLDNLVGAGIMHRDALEIELAVGLAHFGIKADAAKADLNAKKSLRALYEKAGYACKTPAGEDYKTVMRRIGATADLYAHIGGRETLVDWIGEAKPAKMVEAVAEQLKQYHFNGMSDVQALVGKAAQKRAPRQTNEEKNKGTEKSATDKAMDEALALIDQTRLVRQLAEQKGIPEGRVFKHGALTLVIPFEATYDDVVGMAQDLMAFAKTQMPLPVGNLQTATVQ